MGVAYKKDIGDLRESPALDIIHLLQAKGAMVSYHDPYGATGGHAVVVCGIEQGQIISVQTFARPHVEGESWKRQ